jgi:RNA polymerase sigma factor (sigma-70 family)
MKNDSDSGGSRTKFGRFELTQWSIIQSAQDAGSPEAHAALEAFCAAYWRPLYSYIRRRGYKEEDAQDLTQSFFARLLDKNYLSAVDRTKGKFRTFLLTSLENFLKNEHRYRTAQKRDGKVSFISFDTAADEGLADNLADDAMNPERVFEQQWVVAMLNQVFPRLQGEFTKTHTPELFADIKSALVCETDASSYKEIAAKHGTTEAAIKMTVSRLRKRFGQLLMEELSNTVSSPEELAEELRALFAAFN